MYQKEGLNPPISVINATTSYRTESDKLGLYIKDCLVEDSAATLDAKTAYQAYVNWCRSSGYGIDNKKNFFNDLKSKNLFSSYGTVHGKTIRNVIKGYRLCDDLLEISSYHSYNEPPPFDV